jgi:MFS family permease
MFLSFDRTINTTYKHLKMKNVEKYIYSSFANQTVRKKKTLNKYKSIFTRNIILLSFVSLFNDISSEMLIPILPVYLSSIGFTALYIGLLEGLAEAVSGLSKAYFGRLSDKLANRLIFVRTGYFMSALSKSMLALFNFPIWIFTARTMDRFGKGVRTGARDALLADESSHENRGKVFGFNKAMDTIGASIGPLVAIVYLYFFPGNYKMLFLIAFAPALISVFITFTVKEKVARVKTKEALPKLFSFFSYWKSSSVNYKRITIGFLLFALFNSSDAFIFLIGKSFGLKDTKVLGCYIIYNIAFALLALPFGHLGDKIGMKRTYLIGIAFFVAAYFIFPSGNSLGLFLSGFVLYAFYSAATDGISKAWISINCKTDEKASALGFYSGMQSLVILLSNIIAGIIWSSFSAQSLFYFSSLGGLLVAMYFLLITRTDRKT